MVKVKNKRNSGLADRVHSKKKQDVNKKKINPFEVHINKEKLKVLGKKSKHDRGLPGVSRAKAIQKRKETLGTEMKLMNKTNTFIDRRIGEKNTQLSAEDRMVARFAAERALQHNKKNIYNLADDEILTHRGQTLEQIEKFDDPRSSDEEDEDKKFGGLDDNFVAEGHFGGGMLSKVDKDGAKSHKDLIEQLIAESKKRKAEKQKEKEQTLDLTEKLDTEWKDLQPVVFKRPRVEEESIIDKVLSNAEKKAEDYDKMMRELKFERRGTPSDGLKSLEKQSKEEKARLEQLERERELRMLGDDEIGAAVPKAAAAKHRSADDLDDNFALEDEKEFMLAYDKDGNPLVPDHIFKANSVPGSKQKFEDGISDTSSDDDDNDEEGSEEESDNDDGDDELNQDTIENQNVKNELDEQTKTIKSTNVKKNNDQSGSDCDKGVREEHIKSNVIKQKLDTIGKSNKEKLKSIEVLQNGTDSDNASQMIELKYDDSHDDSDSNDSKDKIKGNKKSETKLDFETIKSNKKHNEKDEYVANESEGEGDSENYNDSEKSNESGIEKDNYDDLRESEAESDDEIDTDVEKDIESFFDLKATEGENLKELLSNKTPAQQSIALQKLIKSYDPSLAEDNKDKLSRLFAHLLQYINDIFAHLTEEAEVIKAFLIFDKLAPYFYDLAQKSKVITKKFLIQLLKEKHDNFLKRHRRVPDLDTLIFFKLVSLLYPTSDFRHPVTTPSFTFMTEILTLSKFRDPYSISRGLFIVSLILEYTTLSKRFVPSAINFLRGICYLAANTSILNPIQVVPPFKLHKDVKILNLDCDCSKMAAQNKMSAKDLVSEKIDDDFRIRVLASSVEMVKEFFNNLQDIECLEAIFESHIKLLSRVDLDWYPNNLSKVILKAVQDMKETLEMKTYTPLCREKKKPKVLRLYEPDVQDVFTGSKGAKLTREQAEVNRLQYKIKKEMKGALREIRRDKAYIASVKIKQKIHSDNVRKDKVKQIYKDAAIQQGELNKLKRMK